jgi:hypothetical protein
VCSREIFISLSAPTSQKLNFALAAEREFQTSAAESIKPSWCDFCAIEIKTLAIKVLACALEKAADARRRAGGEEKTPTLSMQNLLDCIPPLITNTKSQFYWKPCRIPKD